jgi:hypothetical protein
LGGGGEKEFVSRAAGTAQPEATEPENALQLSEQHLDLLAATPGAFVRRRVRQVSGKSRASS